MTEINLDFKIFLYQLEYCINRRFFPPRNPIILLSSRVKRTELILTTARKKCCYKMQCKLKRCTEVLIKVKWLSKKFAVNCPAKQIVYCRVKGVRKVGWKESRPRTAWGVRKKRKIHLSAKQEGLFYLILLFYVIWTLLTCLKEEGKYRVLFYTVL